MRWVRNFNDDASERREQMENREEEREENRKNEKDEREISGEIGGVKYNFIFAIL